MKLATIVLTLAVTVLSACNHSELQIIHPENQTLKTALQSTPTKLTQLTIEPVGNNCPSGGKRIIKGIDTNADNMLSENEVDSSSFRCYSQDLKAARLWLTVTPGKSVRFNWHDVPGATHYQLLESIDGKSPYTHIVTLERATNQFVRYAPSHDIEKARYLLQTCNGNGCKDSDVVRIGDHMFDSKGI